MADRKTGWGSLWVNGRQTVKAHYFGTDGRSRCGKYARLGRPMWETNQATGETPGRGTCVACWRGRVADEQPKKGRVKAVVAALALLALTSAAAAQGDQVVRVAGRVSWVSGDSIALAMDNGFSTMIDARLIDPRELREIRAGTYIAVSALAPRTGRTLQALTIQPINALHQAAQ